MYPDMIIGALGGLFCMWLVMALKARVPHALQYIPFAPTATLTQAKFFRLLFFVTKSYA